MRYSHRVMSEQHAYRGLYRIDDRNVMPVLMKLALDRFRHRAHPRTTHDQCVGIVFLQSPLGEFHRFPYQLLAIRVLGQRDL